MDGFGMVDMLTVGGGLLAGVALNVLMGSSDGSGEVLIGKEAHTDDDDDTVVVSLSPALWDSMSELSAHFRHKVVVKEVSSRFITLDLSWFLDELTFAGEQKVVNQLLGEADRTVYRRTGGIWRGQHWNASSPGQVRIGLSYWLANVGRFAVQLGAMVRARNRLAQARERANATVSSAAADALLDSDARAKTATKETTTQAAGVEPRSRKSQRNTLNTSDDAGGCAGGVRPLEDGSGSSGISSDPPPLAPQSHDSRSRKRSSSARPVDVDTDAGPTTRVRRSTTATKTNTNARVGDSSCSGAKREEDDVPLSQAVKSRRQK